MQAAYRFYANSIKIPPGFWQNDKSVFQIYVELQGVLNTQNNSKKEE
jgi:hypothetical protein